jgi:hypothetical protein
VIHAEIALGHELFNISVAERKPEIAPNTKNDNRGFELASFEQCSSPSSHCSQAYQIDLGALQHSRLKPKSMFQNFRRRLDFSCAISAFTTFAVA